MRNPLAVKHTIILLITREQFGRIQNKRLIFVHPKLEVDIKGCDPIVSNSVHKVKVAVTVPPKLGDADEIGDATAVMLT